MNFKHIFFRLSDLIREYGWCYALCLIIVGLFFSKALVSISIFLLIFHWIVYQYSFDNLLKGLNNRYFVLFSSIYLMYIVGLLYTNNYDYAFKDLRIKLPIVILPLFIGMYSVGIRELKLTGWVLLFSLCLSIIIILTKFTAFDVIDERKAYPFVSHIRFGIMVAVGMILLIYLFTVDRDWISRITYISIYLFLWIFLIYVSNITGIVLGIVVILISALYYGSLFEKRIYFFAFVLSTMLLIVGYVIVNVIEFSTDRDLLWKLEAKTLSGRLYVHDTVSCMQENGYRVNIYICEEELKKEWNRLSKVKYDSLNYAGEPLKYTLWRYLTSAGYRKDSVGVSKLRREEIKAIERGVSNNRFFTDSKLKQRLYKIYWEVREYIRGGNIDGFSVIQRYIY